ncbi:PTS sugar transporter subunit IIA [Enterococcus casseliflavus]|uniref:PTS sugar transporter subunit IIA n=1 Tax=Enterococcus casseliflavus TaxID=37734 RepID=UPI0035E16CAE
MRKVLVASHGKFASGIANSLTLFLGESANIATIDAYVEGEVKNYESDIKTFITSIGKNEEGLIFTDILGGSVNQKVVQFAQGKENIFIISNMNLPIMINLILSAEALTNETINRLIKESQVRLITYDEGFENMSDDEFL